jgi:hypothetical protein
VTGMRLKFTVGFATLLGCASGCLAQESPVRLNAVKGAPFSAQAVTHSIQELADGNRIVYNTTAAVARDSEGRTRREQGLPEPDRTPEAPETSAVAFIQDPAKGEVYVLDGKSRSAKKIVMLDDKTPRVQSEAPNGGKTGSTDGTTESLGPRLIEGIPAEGTRITRIIPAGQSGNKYPLTIVMETWYAPELQTILLKRTLDPRLGETIYKLTNIDRSEPPHSLFEVPHEYVIREH